LRVWIGVEVDGTGTAHLLLIGRSTTGSFSRSLLSCLPAAACLLAARHTVHWGPTGLLLCTSPCALVPSVCVRRWQRYAVSPAPDDAPYFTLLLVNKAAAPSVTRSSFEEVHFDNSCMGACVWSGVFAVSGGSQAATPAAWEHAWGQASMHSFTAEACTARVPPQRLHNASHASVCCTV
jgi:hypothetical protein